MQVVFFVFSGFLQPWPVMPSGWRWARWISPQSYVFSIMMINEFDDTAFFCTPAQARGSPASSGLLGWIELLMDCPACHPRNRSSAEFGCGVGASGFVACGSKALQPPPHTPKPGSKGQGRST
jgi:hypothetical protein